MGARVERGENIRTEGLSAGGRPGDFLITNADLAEAITNYRFSNNGNGTKRVYPINPDLIPQRTGVNERYALQPLDEAPKDISITIPNLALEAAVDALAQKGWPAESVEGLFCITSYPIGSKISQDIADALNIRNALTLDVYAACAGFGVAITEIKKQDLFRKGRAIFVIPEHYTAMMDMDLNRRMFSDGAFWVAYEDGRDLQIIHAEYTHKYNPAIQMPIDERKIPPGSIAIRIPSGVDYFTMTGEKVNRFLAEEIPPIVANTQEILANTQKGVIDVFHQASRPALETIEEACLNAYGIRIKAPSRTLWRYGNFAAGSTLKELGSALDIEKPQKGDFVRLFPFGAGACASTVVMEVLRSPN